MDVHGLNPALAQGEPTDILGMEAIDVLARVDAIDQHVRIDVRRQRQLHEDAVDLRIGVEFVDQRGEFGLCRRCRQVVIARAETDVLAGTALVANVYSGSSIISDQHNGQPRRRPALRHALDHTRVQVVEQFVGNAFAIEDPGGHRIILRWAGAAFYRPGRIAQTPAALQ